MGELLKELTEPAMAWIKHLLHARPPRALMQKKDLQQSCCKATAKPKGDILMELLEDLPESHLPTA